MMPERYIYDEKQKAGRKTTGYGCIKDTKPENRWNNEIATIYGSKKAPLVLDALNLYEALSKIRKSCTKKEIREVLKKYKIEL